MKKRVLFLFHLLISANIINASHNEKAVSTKYGFIENKGQIFDQNYKPNTKVLYLFNGNGLNVQLRNDGFSYEVIKTVKTPKVNLNIDTKAKLASEPDSFDLSYHIHRVDINFKNCSKDDIIIKPFDPSNDFINYYTGATHEGGVTSVKHFQKVIYENVYPNIDIEFVLNDATNNGKFKYNFIVKPNGNLSDIKMDFVGANRTSLNQMGNIIIETINGNLEENIPLSYVINKDNSHKSVTAKFISISDNVFGIIAENYDQNQTLIIDPTNWASYYGGNGMELGNDIATDSLGNIIITGETYSLNAIATAGTHQIVFGGNKDAFIAKFNPNGAIQWATYFGGISEDAGKGLTVNINGDIFIVGETKSSSSISTIGAHQTIYGGNNDAFIAKFNSNGTVQWITYYGGSGTDYGRGIAADSDGNIVITGITSSTNAIATTGAHQTQFSHAFDAFVAKFNVNGVIQWATYFSGNGYNFGLKVAVDGAGNIIIAGRTYSTTGVATPNAHQTIHGSMGVLWYYDAFIAKFTGNGVLNWATYYGGSDKDIVYGITTDINKNIIVVGETNSPNAISTSGAYQALIGGNVDAFVAKFDSNGVRLWATYFGGSSYDYGYGITTDFNQNIIITGSTGSANLISTSGAHQAVKSAGMDAFIAQFNSNGVIQWATYYGGNNNDNGSGIITDKAGNIIMIGTTSSVTGISTPGVYQTINGGAEDAYIAKFSNTGTLPVKLISFYATLVNEKVNCSWETATENNNNYFTIERSKDGSNFESIGKVKGQGNTNTNTRYSFIDKLPLEGISFYRIKQTDFDNKYTFSPVRKVSSKDNLSSAISIYYQNNNPIVKVNSSIESYADFELLSMDGVQLFNFKQLVLTGENIIPLNKNGKSGFYLLKVQFEDKVEFFKVWLM